MPQTQNNRTIETTTEARAGVTGQKVRYVLVFGTMAVIALFTVVFLYYFA
jgi:hypothetical protein